MKDNFSRQADLYAVYRPGYPKELFHFILQQVQQRNAAWDCATGNGQSAKELAPYFEKIFATDTSQKQLEHAYPLANIIYSQQPAERTNFPDSSFDLVTVSQALHWFRFEDFYREVKRVSRPDAWVAVWMYSLLRISPAIDTLIAHYHFDFLRDYWDKERKYVDDDYQNIPFPFNEIKTPVFESTYYWTMDQLEGYFNTWSALQQFKTKNNYSPVKELISHISAHWTGEKMQVVFPIHLRMAPVHK